MIEQLGGKPATIIPVEPDEPPIQIGRLLNQNFRTFFNEFLPNFWLP
ncbi:hypothetical protein [Crocosphaera sp. XPORK-15E]|nr:hypothetical protein [Crocosphaera sp. XPORK-15E]MEA5532536.1 hypothetical protein [Crocosphaera sp. XPORK-15E]